MGEAYDSGAKVLFWVLLIVSIVGIVQGFCIRFGYIVVSPAHEVVKTEESVFNPRLQERLSAENDVTTVELVER